MVAPINYNVDVVNPFEESFKGYQRETSIFDANQARQQQANKRFQAQQQAKVLQNDLSELFNNPNADGEDFAKITLKHPNLKEHFKQSWGMLNESKKTETIKNISQVHAALVNGAPDTAIDVLEEQRQGAINSGEDDEAKKIELMQKQIKLNPDSVRTSTGLSLQNVLGADEFRKRFVTPSAKIGTFKFDPKVGIVDTTTGDVKTSIKELGVPTTDPDVKFEQENKLRKDFNSVTGDFRVIRDAYSRVEAAGKNPSPAGDLALIFNYMKILDPPSVVRESEFKTAKDAKAWLGRASEKGTYVPNNIRQFVLKARDGQMLLNDQRKDFMKRAEMLFNTRDKQYNKTANEYRGLAKRYGLEHGNVVLDLSIVEDEDQSPVVSESLTVEPVLDQKVEDILNKYRD